jgi:hypothetical protein
VGDRVVPGLALADRLDRDALDADGTRPPRRALRVVGDLQPVGARAERSEQDAVLGRRPAEEDEVLRGDAVHGQGQDRGLAAPRPPVAALAGRGDGGHRLGPAIQAEGVLVEREGSGEQEREGAHGGDHHGVPTAVTTSEATSSVPSTSATTNDTTCPALRGVSLRTASGTGTAGPR